MGGGNKYKHCIVHVIVDNVEDRGSITGMFISWSYFLTHSKLLQGINISLIIYNK